MKPLREYDIPYVGLKEGEHVYDYVVNDTFFSLFEYSELETGDVAVKLLLEKKANMMILNFSFKGMVQIPCDRCTDEMDFPVEGDRRLIVKYGDAAYEQTDEIISLPDTEYKLKTAKYILEFIELLLPQRRIHNEGECNEAMLNMLDSYLITEEKFEPSPEQDDDDDIDPRWAALKGLNNDED